MTMQIKNEAVELCRTDDECRRADDERCIASEAKEPRLAEERRFATEAKAEEYRQTDAKLAEERHLAAEVEAEEHKIVTEERK